MSIETSIAAVGTFVFSMQLIINCLLIIIFKMYSYSQPFLYHTTGKVVNVCSLAQYMIQVTELLGLVFTSYHSALIQMGSVRLKVNASSVQQICKCC